MYFAALYSDDHFVASTHPVIKSHASVLRFRLLYQIFRAYLDLANLCTGILGWGTQVLRLLFILL